WTAAPAALRLAEDQVHDPAAADVLAALAAVGEDVGVGAAGVLEGVGQDRQVMEGPLVVDAAGDGRDGAVVPRQPGGVDSDGTERERAEQIMEDRDAPAAKALILNLPTRKDARCVRKQT